MKHKFKPDWATRPADHIREYLAERGWKQADLARASGLSAKNVSDIMSGGRLTARSALALEKAFGLKAHIWLGIQANWDLHEARKTEHGQ